MHDEGAIALVAAIVRQAIADYYKAKPWQKEYKDLQVFFLTSPFVAAAGIDPVSLIREIDRARLKAVKPSANI